MYDIYIFYIVSLYLRMLRVLSKDILFHILVKINYLNYNIIFYT